MLPESRPPLRILHLNFHRGWGGQPQRILVEARELARIGHAVALAVPGDGLLAERGRAEGIPVYGDVRFRPPARALSFLEDARAIRNAVREFQPDLVHSHGSQDTWATLAANRTAGALRRPHVVTRHNTKRVADSAANRFLYRRIDRLIVVSESVIEQYAPYVARGILERAEIAVIPSPVDAARFDGAGPADPTALRTALGVPAGAPLIGCVGRLVPDKGQRHLIDAAAVLHQRHPEARYLLVGTGTEEPALRAQVARLNLEGIVIFAGFRNDVPAITAALDISVLPSVDCDASSAVLKEAMLLGKPVVATDIGGAREILEPGPSGLVVPPGDARALADAIARVLEDRALAGRLSASGPAIARERYSVARFAADTIAVYRELLRPAPAAGTKS